MKASIELKHIPYFGYSNSAASVNGIQPALKDTVSKIMDMYNKEEYYNLTLIFTYISEKKPEISLEQILPPDIARLSASARYSVPAGWLRSMHENFIRAG